MNDITSTVIIIILIILAIVAISTFKFYIKTPPNLALIRTGLGGKRVIIDGGLFVFPVFHQYKWISLETVKLKVLRNNKEGVITKDKYRVDIGAEFYMRIEPIREDVETASRSLGDRTLSSESLRAIMEEKLISAIRAICAERTISELHINRVQLSKEIKDLLKETLFYNGFTLEDVSIYHLDQTKKDQLDPNNIFDAEGLKQITAQTSLSIRERNEIERDTEVTIKQKDVDSTKLKLKLDQEKEFAISDQTRDVEKYRAQQRSDTEQFKYNQETLIRKSEIIKDRDINEMEIAKDAFIIQKEMEKERTSIDKEMTVEIAKAAKEIGIIEKEKEKIEHEKGRIEAEAVRRTSLQKVITAEKEAETERQRRIAVIDAQKDVDVAGLKAKASQLTALAITQEGEAQAAVKLKHREADNIIEPKLIVKDIVEELIKNAPMIFRELMEPAKNIDSIRVLNIGTNSTHKGNGGDTIGNIIGSILGSTAVLPIIKEIMKFSDVDKNKIIDKIKEEMPQLSEYLEEGDNNS